MGRPFNNTSYEQFLSEERLMASQCKKCGALFLPPRPLCVKCLCNQMEWVEINGKGRLVAFTCITVGTPFMIKEGYERKRPYCNAVVELEKGLRVVARLEGVDTNRPETIRVGTPLIAIFLHRGKGGNTTTFLAFKPLP